MLNDFAQNEQTFFPAEQLSSYTTHDNHTFALLRAEHDKYFIRESRNGHTVALLQEGSEIFNEQLEHFDYFNF